MIFNSPQRRNSLFFAIHYLVCLLIFLGFTLQSSFHSSFLHGLWTILAHLTYPVIYLLPGFAVSTLLLTWPKKATTIAALSLGVLWTFLTEFLLVVDAIILMRFGYHINGMVINLLVTPGGFEAMGLETATLLPAIAGVILALGANSALAILCQRWSKLQRLADKLFSGHKRTAIWGTASFATAFFASMVIVAFADFYSIKDVLMSTTNYPVTFTMRMRKFLRRVGCQEPPREKSLFSEMDAETANLNYPAKPIERVAPEHPYNIIWLTAESLRADLLSPEVMPNAWSIAQKGIHAQHHYSGGHGTRPAMFSMFYGLYGNNWGVFLNCRRPPLFFDWLHQDHYDFLVQTSAKFTYPEFDQTIFASVPTASMVEQKDKFPWKRDVKGIDMLIDFLKQRTPESNPFFAFYFFEGTHAPYTFDETQALKKDFWGEINYATVSEKDAPALYNRQINAANAVDRQIGRLLQALQEVPGLAERTIVVITGDHGEEFFEHGRLGHNSTFVDEQICPPLAIYIPGVPPQKITHSTHHTDIIPTLAPFLGVKNSPADYSVGESILDPNYNRKLFIVSGWDIDTIVTPEYKYIIPTGGGKMFIGRNFFTADDEPLPDENEFLRTHSKLLLEVNQDMMHFIKRKK